MTMLPRLMPLRAPFLSSETGAPFTNCISCGCALLEGDQAYLIERAVRQIPDLRAKEVVFEYAMCLSCYEALYTKLSAASLERIDAFFSEHVDYEGRARTLLAEPQVSLDPWLAQCMVDGTPRESLTEYQMVAYCIGSDIVLAHTPCLIGGPALEQVVDLLSNETLDELGGFADDHLGLPPELKKLMRPSDFVLI